MWLNAARSLCACLFWPVSGFNASGPLTVMATRNTTTKALVVFLSNFAPDDNKHLDDDDAKEQTEDKDHGICYKMRPNKCTETSCYLQQTDFHGGDLLPEAQKFRTDNASACCDACVNYKVDKFCQAWSWREAGTDPHRCYLKSGDALSHRTHSASMIAGFPDGIQPPTSDHSYYNISREYAHLVSASRSACVHSKEGVL